MGNLTAQQDLDSARRALAESLPEVSVARAERYLAANPQLKGEQKTAALLLLGESYLRSGQNKEALATLAQVPDSNSSARDYWQGMALAHQQNYSEALAKFSQVASDHSLYGPALFNSLELQMNLNKADLAFELLAKLRAYDPDFLSLQLIRLEAQLYLTKNEPDKARSVLLALEKEDPPSPEREVLSGKIELADQQYDAALSAFAKLLTPETPPRIRALALLGQCDAFLQTSAFEPALQSLLSLLRMAESERYLPFIADRFDLLIERAPAGTKVELIAPLNAYVNPENLGEDGNLQSPQKLLACYSLARLSDADRDQELLQIIVTLAPKGELTARAYLHLGRLSLESGDAEAALPALKSAEEASPGSPVALAAVDLSARIKTQEGDLAAALPLFAKAAQHPDPAFSERALLNEALLALTSNPDAPLSSIAAQLDSEEAKVSLSLERALALAREKAPSGRTALEEFIFQHPDHPRTPQARLALVELLLLEQQPDFELIEVQLASLPETFELPLSGRRFLSRQRFRVSHQLGVITDNWGQAIANGDRYRRAFPEAENDPYFLLRFGESHYRDGNFDRARVLFSKVATLPDAGELVELALYYRAISNLDIPTDEATTKALDTLDELIQRAGPLASRARLTKARTQVDLGRAEECLETLEGIPGEPGDQPEAALIAARAYRDLSAGDSKVAEKAVSIYRRLLNDPRTSYQLSNQIHYLLSRTYLESGFPNLAIDPCLSVVDFENRDPDETEVEWDYYYRCGFQAIDILLEAKHPRAALILARKLAQTKGPSAEEAKERARQIQLDHQLWAD